MSAIPNTMFVSVRELIAGWSADNPESVYNGKARFTEKRERFRYTPEEQENVVRGILEPSSKHPEDLVPVSGRPPMCICFTPTGEGHYEILNGRCRIESLCRFVGDMFAVDGKRFSELTEEDQNKLRDFKLVVGVVAGCNLELSAAPPEAATISALRTLTRSDTQVHKRRSKNEG